MTLQKCLCGTSGRLTGLDSERLPKQVLKNNTAVAELLEQKHMQTSFRNPGRNSLYVLQTASPTNFMFRWLCVLIYACK
jgi:hypothetical protein